MIHKMPNHNKNNKQLNGVIAQNEMKKYNVMYHNTKIQIPYPHNPRLGKCVACKQEVGKTIKVTALHHTCYEFAVDTVKKNPLLALKNVLELDFFCHSIADGFRNILDGTNIPRMMMVAKLLPEFQKEKLAKFCEIFLEYYNNHNGE